jgi:hypothetical protein
VTGATAENAGKHPGHSRASSPEKQFEGRDIGSITIAGVVDSANPRLQRVLAQLRLYEHPLLDFDARAKGDAVEVIIRFKDPNVPVHTYFFELHPRDLDHSQFEWTFQRQLYDCLHDYLIEMFVRTPQSRAERQRQDP